MRIPRLVFMCSLCVACCVAQTNDFHRSNLTVDFGAAIPSGNDTNYLSAAPLISFGYGYRFNRLFQADVGFQTAFGAANNQNAVETEFGPVQGGDHEYMIPLGGRYIIPLHFHRVEVSAGGGAIYLHYSETAPSNGYDQSGCYNCTSRGGWGGYGLANVSYYFDENHTFHAGTTFQFVSASVSGQVVGNTPAATTTDHWANISIEFGISF